MSSVPREKISQKSNYAGDFGVVLRSSALFYYRNKKASFSTTFSFLNYWKQKRDLQVAIIASLRDMTGRLFRREELKFGDGEVLNYRPCGTDEDFEGSVEIEIFSTQNLVIPYAAVMAIYETPKGVSIVHSYGRAYSTHEIEEGRTITQGEEACWTLRDDSATRSFGVFHNGHHQCESQVVQLHVRNAANEARDTKITLPALMPYQTVKIVPAEHIPDLVDWLDGKPGHASISFHVVDAFTRMLIGNERNDGSDFQVTHSNFNYSKHETDHVEVSDQKAYMVVLPLPGIERTVEVYPDCDPGAYTIQFSGKSVRHSTGQATWIPLPQEKLTLEFRKESGALPSRIVTSLVTSKAPGVLPNECSLGIEHHQRPRKRSTWGLASARPDAIGVLYLHAIPQVYGEIADDTKITLKLFSTRSHEPLEATLTGKDMPRLERGMPCAEIWPGAGEFLGGDFGYFTVSCEYGGLLCYSSLENRSGSFTMEHAF
ncbi:MAG: hypothetical protein ABJF10_26085 [Chthoniobacter sp.]|uniref:hypothetical protein n=1 Tax=Chthoniobacter sp. TaxID=2510640 RepID=UPI0032ACEB08